MTDLKVFKRSDQRELAQQIADGLNDGLHDGITRELHAEIAATVLTSEWLADHDAAVRKEALREAAAFVKAEIERLELVKGTYAKAQRRSLGMVWGHLRSDVLAEGDTNA